MGSSLGGEVCAFSEEIGHVALRPGFFGPFEHLSPGMIGFEACKSLLTHIRGGETVAGERPVRHFLTIQQALDNDESDNGLCSPGVEKPAGGPTRAKSDVAPYLRMLRSSPFCSGAPHLSRGVPFQENGSA